MSSHACLVLNSLWYCSALKAQLTQIPIFSQASELQSLRAQLHSREQDLSQLSSSDQFTIQNNVSSSTSQASAATVELKYSQHLSEAHILPFAPQLQDTVIKLMTVNPAMRAIEEYNWMPRFMQPRFVLLIYPDSLRVVTYGFVAQDLKDVRGTTPTNQHTKCVVRLLTNNLFLDGDKDKSCVAKIHCQPLSTSCKAIEQVIRHDIDNVLTHSDKNQAKGPPRPKIRPHPKIAEKTIVLIDQDFNSDSAVREYKFKPILTSLNYFQ